MTKADLIEIVSKKANITRTKADVIVNVIFNAMAEALKNNDRVEIRDFGSFEVRNYDAYKGRNPKTGDVIDVPQKRLAFFKVGKNLKIKVAALKNKSAWFDDLSLLQF